MKTTVLALTAVLAFVTTSAQPGIEEMHQAGAQFKTSFFSALDLAFVTAAIFGICGAARIYHNWQMGYPRMDREVAGWFFGAIFMVLAGGFLRGLFGM